MTRMPKRRKTLSMTATMKSKSPTMSSKSPKRILKRSLKRTKTKTTPTTSPMRTKTTTRKPSLRTTPSPKAKEAKMGAQLPMRYDRRSAHD